MISEEKLLEKVLEQNPDGKITKISSLKNYPEIYRAANDKNMTVSEYLHELGFEVWKLDNAPIDTALEQLLEQFPDGKITKISEINNYYEIKKLASYKNITVPEFLIEIGFEAPKKMNEDEALEKLLEIFPDKKVFSLHEYINLKNALQRNAENKGLSLTDYLKEHGYEMIRKPKENNAIPVELAVLEKEKYIGITKYDELLMQRLVEEYDFVASDFSELFGVSKQAITSKMKKKSLVSKFNWFVNEIPNKHFKVILEMIEERLPKRETDTHRYYISYSKANNDFIFTIFPFDTSEFPMAIKGDYLSDEVYQKLLDTEYDVFTIRDLLILHELRNAPQESYDSRGGSLYASFRRIAKIHINHHSQVLKDSNLYEDTENSLLIFANHVGLSYEVEDKRRISDEEIQAILQSFYNPESGLVKIPSTDEQYHRLVSLASRGDYEGGLKGLIEKHGFKYERYRDDYGFDGAKLKKQMANRLENYKVTNDTVYISSYTKLYVHLSNISRLKGLNLTDYLKKEYNLNRVEKKDLPSGYIPYELGDSEEDLDKEERFLDYIETNLMIDAKKSLFYIDSTTTFYAHILKYCNLIGITVDEFFQKWELNKLTYVDSLAALMRIGFSQVEAEEFLDKKLPDFNELDNNPPSDDTDTVVEEDRIELDEDIVDTTNEDETNPTNEINETEIEETGPTPDTVEETEEVVEDEKTEGEDGVFSNEDVTTEEQNDNTIIQKLKELSITVKDVQSETIKKSRSQELVRLMKELYDYKCQLCDPLNPIPLITMTNGKNYVEMHHIIALSTSNAEDETDMILDDYTNAVVVCGHHHKVLHYHHGGFTEIDEMIDGLYFINDETEIKIHTNKHLEKPVFTF